MSEEEAKNAPNTIECPKCKEKRSYKWAGSCGYYHYVCCNCLWDTNGYYSKDKILKDMDKRRK